MEIPNSNTNASRNVHASSDRVVVVRSLLREASVGGDVADVDEADVELGQRGLHAGCGVGLHDGDELRAGWGVADFEVGLEAGAVDAAADGADLASEVDDGVGLCSWVWTIVLAVFYVWGDWWRDLLSMP